MLLDRRTVLSGSGGAVLLSLLRPAAAVAQPSGVEQANVKVVSDFCAAWSTRDLAVILPFLADDAVYRMTETTPPASGHAGVIERLGAWVERSSRIEFRVLESFAKGPVVVNHRIDRFEVTPRPLVWEGIGVFFLTDGRIKEWSDYTIRVER
jgi:limonene-1,2-epoxide hydrolase